MGVFLNKNVKTFDDGNKNKNYTKVWMPPFILFFLIYNPRYIWVKINCLLPPIAELLRWESGVVFQETAVLGGSCIPICLRKRYMAKLTLQHFFSALQPILN